MKDNSIMHWKHPGCGLLALLFCTFSRIYGVSQQNCQNCKLQGQIYILVEYLGHLPNAGLY